MLPGWPQLPSTAAMLLRCWLLWRHCVQCLLAVLRRCGCSLLFLFLLMMAAICGPLQWMLRQQSLRLSRIHRHRLGLRGTALLRGTGTTQAELQWPCQALHQVDSTAAPQAHLQLAHCSCGACRAGGGTGGATGTVPTGCGMEQLVQNCTRPTVRTNVKQRKGGGAERRRRQRRWRRRRARPQPAAVGATRPAPSPIPVWRAGRVEPATGPPANLLSLAQGSAETPAGAPLARRRRA